MKLIPLLYLLILYPLKTQLKKFDGDLVKDVVNFLRVQVKPTKVVAYLCWPAVYKFHLKKNLHMHQLATTFPKFGNNSEVLCKVEAKELLFYVVDMECENSEKLLIKANNNNKLIFPHRWLILGNVSKIPDDLSIFVSSRVYLIHQDDNHGRKVISIYKIDKSRSYIIHQIGKFDNINELKYLSDTKNRSDLQGMHMNLSLVIIHNETLLHLEDLKDKQNDALTKHNWILVNHIADLLNITRHFRFHNTWGYINPNTSLFNGEFGDLQQHISEIGATPGFFMVNRIPIVDYIICSTPTTGRFIFRAPPLSMVSNVFTLPFDVTVWYACFLLLFLIFVTLFVIVKLEWWSDGFSHRPNWIEVIQMEIGAVCQQGVEAEPRSGAGRIATFTMVLSFMFLYVSYSANIVALLQSTTDSFRTLEDLLNSRIKLGVEDTPYKVVYGMQKGEVQKAIYHEKIQPNNFFNASVGVTKIRDEFFAFHSEPNTIYQLVNKMFQENEKCGLTEIKYLPEISPWVPIRKNSPYKELIKIGYLKLKEAGLQNRNYLKFYTEKPLCQNKGANFINVSIDDCYFASLCFGIGICIAFFIFVFEMLISNLKQRNQINS